MNRAFSADGQRRGRARPLPQARALVGALLVVVAVGLTTAITRTPPVDDRSPYVVVARDLHAGEIIAVEDLRTALLQLDTELSQGAFTDPEAVVGAVMLSSRRQGELIQSGDVAPAASTDGRTAAAEISFPVERARAPRALEPGERVTVMATRTEAGQASTEVAIRDALVVAYELADDGFAAASTATLTLALGPDDDPVAVAHASQVAELTIVRTNGTRGGADD